MDFEVLILDSGSWILDFGPWIFIDLRYPGGNFPYKMAIGTAGLSTQWATAGNSNNKGEGQDTLGFWILDFLIWSLDYFLFLEFRFWQRLWDLKKNVDKTDKTQKKTMFSRGRFMFLGL